MLVMTLAGKYRPRVIYLATTALTNVSQFGGYAFGNEVSTLVLEHSGFNNTSAFGSHAITILHNNLVVPLLANSNALGSHNLARTVHTLAQTSHTNNSTLGSHLIAAVAPVLPWDTNGSLPASLSNSSSSNATLSGVSTTNANDLLLAFYGSAGGGTVTVPSVYTSQVNALNAGGTNFSRCAIASKAVSAAQSSISQAWTHASQSWGVIGDALAGSGAAPVVEDKVSKSFSTTNSTTVTIANVQAGEVIVLAVHCEKNGSTQTVTSITDDKGHTYSRRKQLQWTGGGSLAGNNFEIWWARVPSNVVGNTTITLTLSATTDDAQIGVLRVSGCVF